MPNKNKLDIGKEKKINNGLSNFQSKLLTKTRLDVM